MNFLDTLFDELGERRQRLHKVLGPYVGGLVEFGLFSGLVMGLFAVFFGKWVGLAPFGAFVVGYGALDWRRQRAIAAGAAQERLRLREDLLALLLALAMAGLGAALLVNAMDVDHPKTAPATAPDSSIDLDIVK